MAGFYLHELIRRRIPQIAGVYLAAAWGILEFTDWVITRFGWDPAVTDMVIYILAFLLPVALIVAWRGKPVAHPGQAAAWGPARRSIAVLPFANAGGEPASDYFSDGLTDEIIVTLSKLEGMRVASRTSSFAFKGQAEDVRRIGHELNVESVLEGSVQRVGERIRVNTQLVSTADGYHLWSERFDCKVEDVFAIEDEIAQSVAGAMRVILRGEERRALRQVAPADIRAYDFYLRGRQFFHQMRKKSLQYAGEMYERAIEIDPAYARAYVGVAEAGAQLQMFYPTSSDDLARADAASLRALELAPELPEAHSARGFVLFQLKQLDEAEREFRIAIEIEPQLFEAQYLYARACFHQGRFEEAARLFREASQIREDYESAFFAAQSLEALGNKERAAEAYRHALELATRQMEFNPDDPRAATMRAVSLCRAGQPEEGLHWAEQALAIDPGDAGVRYNVACLYALEGEKDRAFECLEEAVRAGFGNRAWIEKDPDLESLRDDPRFTALMTGH